MILALMRLTKTAKEYYCQLWRSPVGLETLAATINEEAIVEDMYEPFLLQQGFLTRTPRGRCATQLAYKHLNMDFIGQQSFDI